MYSCASFSFLPRPEFWQDELGAGRGKYGQGRAVGPSAGIKTKRNRGVLLKTPNHFGRGRAEFSAKSPWFHCELCTTPGNQGLNQWLASSGVKCLES